MKHFFSRVAMITSSITFVFISIFAIPVSVMSADSLEGKNGTSAQLEGKDGTSDSKPSQVQAKTGVSSEKIKNPLGQGANLDSIIRKILSGINVIAAMVVTFFIILGGFKYVTAMGDEKKITDAHNTLKWTVIGAAILFGAQVIANIIQNTVTELSKVK